MNFKLANHSKKFRPTPDKIFVLMGMAFFFNLTFFMSFLAPYPLTMALILHGRKKGYLAIALCLILAYFLAPFFGLNYILIPTFALGSLFAILFSELTFRGVSPVRILFWVGTFVSALLLSLYFWYSHNHVLQDELMGIIKNSTAELTKNSAKFIEEQGEQARELLDMLKRPESLLKEIMESLPFNIVVGSFLVVWINLLLIMRSLRPYAQMMLYPYSDHELTHFRVPDFFLWGVIVALIMALGGEYLEHLTFDVAFLGKKFLMVLGTFYLFQGFGILLEMLTFLRVVGIVRTFFVAIALIFGYWLLALVGLFDTFVDFRRFFVRKIP